MQTLNTVEDYLEVLGGYKRIDTTTDNPYGVSPFKLANQDKLVVSNFAWQSVRGVGLTHKQSELAIKLITKYQKQLKQRGIDAKEILLAPRYRYFFRTIEKNKVIDIENNTIRIRFPYDTRLITDVYNWVGSKLYAYGEWNSVKKQWNIDLTENSLLHFYEWGSRNAFYIDNTIQELYNNVQRVRLTAEQYLTKLVKHESGYTVANASETLQDYLNNNGWNTITEDNVELLIDSCDLLGIHVSKEIKDTLSTMYGEVYYNIISNHMTKILSLPENYEVLDRYMSNNRHRSVYVISPNNLFDEDNKRFMDGLKETHPSLDMIKIANFEKESYNNLEGHILLVNMTKIFSWYWFYQSRFVINSHKIILLVSDEKFAKDVPNAQRMEVDAWPLYFNNS